ncbi:hypothetical protein Nepgr_025744 [Nepenthes gracilis]|uniref:Protein WVD2-like 7 n=1 Tax=Nepenthes gracilis TaxID=150966 RepID=A0AAD3T8G6_NEPGR|nr:hypothetical protein Nepgr_025744 [Nepenthes gracilis]
MGEPTCVMHGFSYTSNFSNDTHEQEDPMYERGESVSFGRFMSEPLAWEKWSAFSSNRYVEEAEKYSQPGSVAQKKAYFEAHFKKKAELKAAALLGQANASPDAPGSMVEDEVLHCTAQDYDAQAQQLSSFSQDRVIDRQSVQNEGQHGGFLVENDGIDSISVKDELKITNFEDPNSAIEVESERQLVDVEKFNGRTEMELSSLAQIEKPPLQDYEISQDVSVEIYKRNPPLSFYISSVEGRAPLISSSPAKSAAEIQPGREENAKIISNESLVDDLDRKRTPLQMTINRELNKLLSPVIKKSAGSSKPSKDFCSTPLNTPAKDYVDGAPNPPASTPKSAERGARMPFSSSAYGSSKPVGSRWHFLSKVLNSPRAIRNMTSSPIIPTSFCLRSSERAARRKAEKDEQEFTKLSGSFCFKPQPVSNYHDQTETAKSSLQKSPKTGTKPGSRSFQSINCFPPLKTKGPAPKHKDV